MELIHGNSDFLNKKMKLFSFVLIGCILSGCGRDLQTLQSQEIEESVEETLEVSTQEPFVREMSESPYYRIYLGSTMEDRFYYYYDLFDADGNQVDHTCTYMAEPQISEVSDHVLRISAQAGTGRGCIWFYYYDVNENRSSVPHDYPLAQKAPLVAYFDGKHVIVSDMFDPESYYKEIVLDNEFSNSIEPVLDAEFSEDLSHLIVLYESGEEYREVREIVDL